MILEIPSTKVTPKIIFRDGVLVIEGKSILQKTESFYEPLLKMFKVYSMMPNEITRMEFRFEYLNSDSMRSLMNILIIAEQMHNKGKKIFVDWYYQDEKDVIFDFGMDFQSLIDIPINMKRIAETNVHL